MALLKKQSIKASMELREFLHSIISGIILVLLIMHNKKHQSLHLPAHLPALFDIITGTAGFMDQAV